MSEYSPRRTNKSVLTSVGDSATSVTILASNPQRQGASIVNASSAVLYLRLNPGAATATTGHSVQLPDGAYYELPFGYTGIVTGIWASDAGGSANVTEYT